MSKSVKEKKVQPFVVKYYHRQYSHDAIETRIAISAQEYSADISKLVDSLLTKGVTPCIERM